jgi:hypothetical protein
MDARIKVQVPQASVDGVAVPGPEVVVTNVDVVDSAVIVGVVAADVLVVVEAVGAASGPAQPATAVIIATRTMSCFIITQRSHERNGSLVTSTTGK